jgi:hypothetical protein
MLTCVRDVLRCVCRTNAMKQTMCAIMMTIEHVTTLQCRETYHAMFNRACQHLRDAYRLRRMSHLRAIEIELYHECMTFARAYRNV